MNKLALAVAIVALIFAGYTYRQKALDATEIVDLREKLQRMDEHATSLEQEVFRLEKENLALRSDSLDQIIQNGEQSLIEKWSDMAEHFSGEMEKLGEMIEKEWEGDESGKNEAGKQVPVF